MDIQWQSRTSSAAVAPPSSQSPPSSPVPVGDLVAGKYRVDSVLGAGGMGVVVAATQVELERRVAIKFLLPEVCDQDEIVVRFLQEARASTKIDSDHVAHVLDVGKLPSGAPYMVMEFLQGNDLGDELDRRGTVPLAEAVDYILQASEALAKAHAAGIVHRDLKPSNLFLVQRTDGSKLVKVVDFGISKVFNPEDGEAELTKSALAMGSPMYMCPEQIRNAKYVDHRADVWALGVTLYQLLCGRPPFQAEQVSGLLAAIIADPHRSARAWNSQIPGEVAAILDRCLEKDRDRRIATMGELASQLRPFASPAGQLAADRAANVAAPRTSMAPPISAMEGDETLPAPSGDGTAVVRTGFEGAVTRHPAKSRVPPIVPVVGALAAVGAAAWAFWPTMPQAELAAAPEAAASVTEAPSAAASASQPELPVESAVSLGIAPADAVVTVDGKEAVVEDGKVVLHGKPGDTFRVEVKQGQQSQVTSVVLTGAGKLIPEEIHLAEPAAHARVVPARPVHTKPRISAVASKPKPPSVTPVTEPDSPTAAPVQPKPAPAPPPQTKRMGPVDEWK